MESNLLEMKEQILPHVNDLTELISKTVLNMLWLTERVLTF